jgi:hypothetical protein
MSNFIFNATQSQALQYSLTLLLNSGYDRPLDPVVVQSLRTISDALNFTGFPDLVPNAPIEALVRLIQLCGAKYNPLSVPGQ